MAFFPNVEFCPTDEAAGREKLAKEIRQYYTNIYADKNRIDLPKMELLRYVVLPYVLSMGQGKNQYHRKALQSLDIHQCSAM